MLKALCPLALLVLLAARTPAQTEKPPTYTPIAPSLPALSEKELAQIDRIIDRFIQFEAGKLKGKEAVQAVADFKELGPEAIPQLIEGLNRAAQEGNSCAAVFIAKKLNGLLGASDDFELLDFARESIGAGLPAKRHTNVLKDLRLFCQLRKSTLQRQQLAYAKVDLDKKPLRVLTLKELSDAAVSASGDKRKTLLIELEQRQGDAVLRTFVSTLDSSETEIKQLAGSLLVKHIARQSPIYIQSRLRDERPDVRSAAATATSRRRLPFGDELIGLLADANDEVRQAARRALVQLSGGVDHGPERNAGEAQLQDAIRDWRAWWKKQP